jgi:hypothetical protein
MNVKLAATASFMSGKEDKRERDLAFLSLGVLYCRPCKHQTMKIAFQCVKKSVFIFIRRLGVGGKDKKERSM